MTVLSGDPARPYVDDGWMETMYQSKQEVKHVIGTTKLGPGAVLITITKWFCSFSSSSRKCRRAHGFTLGSFYILSYSTSVFQFADAEILNDVEDSCAMLQAEQMPGYVTVPLPISDPVHPTTARNKFSECNIPHSPIRVMDELKQ